MAFLGSCCNIRYNCTVSWWRSTDLQSIGVHPVNFLLAAIDTAKKGGSCHPNLLCIHLVRGLNAMCLRRGGRWPERNQREMFMLRRLPAASACAVNRR